MTDELSLFDNVPTHAPTCQGVPTGIDGMTQALHTEGDQGRAALKQLILATMRARAPRLTGADDINHDLVNVVSTNSWGAAFGALAKAGAIEEVGVRRSRRPEARGRLVREYRLAREAS